MQFFESASMPIEYEIDEDTNILVVTASDVITVFDRAAVVQRVSSDSSLPPIAPILVDVSLVENVPEVKDIPRMAFLAEQLAARFKSKVAYFVVQPGMVTAYHLVAISVSMTRGDVRVFSCRSDALKWLMSER